MADGAVVAVETLPDVLILHVLVEQLAEEQLHELQTEARSAAGAQPGLPCVIDLARVNFLPSMSLAALVRLCSEFRARQQRLILAALQPQVRDVFLVTRLDRLFELADDVAAAQRAVRVG